MYKNKAILNVFFLNEILFFVKGLDYFFSKFESAMLFLTFNWSHKKL
jgi:hypothetical protein